MTIEVRSTFTNSAHQPATILWLTMKKMTKTTLQWCTINRSDRANRDLRICPSGLKEEIQLCAGFIGLNKSQ